MRKHKYIYQAVAVALLLLCLSLYANDRVISERRAINTAPSHNASKTIDWVPAEITKQLVVGQLQTVSVSIRVSERLTDVSIWASPSLNRFVVVSPETFALLDFGKTAELRLSFLAPQGTAPGIYEGTIHLRSGARTIPQTLPISLEIRSGVTETWPSAASAQGRFTFRYPPGWMVSTFADGSVRVTTPLVEPVQTRSSLTLYIVPNEKHLPTRQYLHDIQSNAKAAEGGSEVGYPTIESATMIDIPVNSVRAVQFTSPHGFTEWTVYVPRSDDFIVLQAFTASTNQSALYSILHGMLATVSF
jgi:hypothetical protein